MKSVKNSLSLILAFLLLVGVFASAPLSAAAEIIPETESAAQLATPDSADPYPMLEYSADFIDCVGKGFFSNRNIEITITEKNLKDYVTVYRSDASMVIFKVDVFTERPSNLLIDGYMFSSDSSAYKYVADPGYYVYYPENGPYNKLFRIDEAVSQGVVSLDELVRIIPNVKKMDENEYIAHFKKFGYDVTSVTDLGGIFYAVNENESTPETKEIELCDLKFRLNYLASPSELGLFIVSGSNVIPIDREDYWLWGVNTPELLDSIRKAARDGVKFNFTAEFKFGEKAEECLKILNSDIKYSLNMTEFRDFGDFCMMSCSTGMGTCMAYDVPIGNYLFFCGLQTMPYDLGYYIVKDGRSYYLENAYNEKVIDDDDMDKIVEWLNNPWIRKLTEQEKQFLKEKEVSRYMYFDNRQVLSNLGGTEAYTLYYSEYKEGEGITNYGDYKITWGKNESRNSPLGLYIYKDGKFTTIEKAWTDGIINSVDIEEVIVPALREHTDTDLKSIYIESKRIPAATEPSSTQPTAAQPEATQPITTEPAATEPSATQPATVQPTTAVSVIVPHKDVRRANPIKVTAKTKTVKAKKLKKGKLSVKVITVKNAEGKVSFKKLSGSKKLTVTKKGKITIKKGTKKGTYKIKVKITAKGNSKYSAKSVTKTVKVKVN